jgi:hypothetical protein
MEYMTVEEQGMVTTLMAVAGIQDVNFAREFLQDNGWQLEISVNAYMMLIGEDTGGGGGMMGGGMSSTSPESLGVRPHANLPPRPAPAPPANPLPRPAPVQESLRVRPVANPPPRPAHVPSVKLSARPAPAPVERQLVDDMPGAQGPGMKRAAEDVSKLVECAVCLHPFQSEGI